MDEAKEPSLLKPLLLALFLAGCFVFVSSLDYAEAITTEAIRKDPPRYFPASLVVPADAIICQDTGGKPKCRVYVSGTTRKEIR